MPWGALVGAHMCCLMLANAWVIWAGRRHERRSSAGVFYHPGPMAGAAAGMPKVVRVLDVIKSNVDELDLGLGITEDGDIVVVVREVVQRARGVQKSKACQALAGNASENLARALGIAGGIFDTARWPGQPTLRTRVRCSISPRCWTGRWRTITQEYRDEGKQNGTHRGRALRARDGVRTRAVPCMRDALVRRG